jgi:hypothetical protein
MNSCMLMSLLVSDLENCKCFIFVAQSVPVPSLLQCHFLEQFLYTKFVTPVCCPLTRNFACS